jgi:hypothetical protein
VPSEDKLVVVLGAKAEGGSKEQPTGGKSPSTSSSEEIMGSAKSTDWLTWNNGEFQIHKALKRPHADEVRVLPKRNSPVNGQAPPPSEGNCDKPAASPELEPLKAPAAFLQEPAPEARGKDEAYTDMMRSLNAALDTADKDDDADIDCGLTDLQCTLSKFVDNGHTLDFYGMNRADSQFCRTEFLRQHLEEQLGLDAFLGAYRLLSQSIDGVQVLQGVRKVLGDANMRYIHLIRQLLYYEECGMQHQGPGIGCA